MSTSPENNRPAIAVVGVSALFPGSLNATGFWRDILNGKDMMGPIPTSHWLIDDYYDADPKSPDKTYAQRGAFLGDIDFDAMGFGLPPNILPATDTSQLLALIVAQKVLEDVAQGSYKALDRSRTSVILGVTSAQELLASMVSRLQKPVWVKALRESGLPEREVQAACERISANYAPWQESTFPGLLGNVVAGRIANRLDLGGTNCITDAACASTFSAVSMGVNELYLGDSDMVVVGGVDTMNDIFMFMCFSKTPALSPSGDCRPFDQSSDGTMLGEGLGMVALKRLEDAERDGDPIYGVIRGVGASSDGRSKSVYAPVSAGQAKAIRRAYDRAGFDASTVELVEAHGTGTKAGDVAEFGGLRMVFEESERADKGWCALGSVKSQIGHTKAAAGAAGLIKAIFALRHKTLPPTIKIDRPNPKLELDASPFYLNTETRPWVRGGDHPRRAGISSFGFGGSNFHIAVEEYLGEGNLAGRLRSQGTEIVLLSDDTLSGLKASIANHIEGASQKGYLPWLAGESQRSFQSTHSHRLALVAEDEASLVSALEGALKRLDSEGGAAFVSPDGTAYGHGKLEGKVAFLFPGQGSQYVAMGGAVATAFDNAMDPWAQAADMDFGGDMALHEVVYPRPVFDEDARKAQSARLTQTEWAQPALGCTSLSYLALLRSMGCQADMVAGHSFGEVTALGAAGVLTLEDTLTVARKRGELMAEAASIPGGMIALSQNAVAVKALVERSGADVVIANHNSPKQVVVSGPLDGIDAFEAFLKTETIRCRRLNVATAFHSKVVASAVEPFSSALGEVTFAKGSLPVFANSEAGPYPQSPKKARAILGEQIAKPVRFVEMLQAMFDAGARTFIEVGPGSVLTGLVKHTLGDKGAVSVSLDKKKKAGGLAPFLKGIAHLAALGAELDVSALFAEYRESPNPSTLPKPKLAIPINGANLGKPYPPLEGSAGLPAPNPPREIPLAAAPEAPAQTPNGTPDVSTLNEPTRYDVAPDPAPVPPAMEESMSKNPMDVGAQPQVQTPQGYAQPQAYYQPMPVNPMLQLFQESQRQTAEAQVAYQRAMAEAHVAYLRTAETGFMAMTAMVTGAPMQMPAPLAQPQVAATPAASSQPMAHGAPQWQPAPMAMAQQPQWQPAPIPQQPQWQPSPGAAAPAPQAPVSNGKAHRAPAAASMAAAPAPAPVAAAPSAPAPVAAAPAPTSVAPTPAPAATAPSRDLKALMLSVVADKTGYPADMLNLDMELEGDLGIDSIKRVEILSAFQEQAPELPEVKAADMASLTTLGQIVDYMAQSLPGGGSGETAVSTNGAAASAASGANEILGSLDLKALMLSVVADKTGYPADMLSLEMELEGDLGIDSIKRVEILSAFQEQAPGLPEIQASEMASLTTLGQIVAFMEGNSAPIGGAKGDVNGGQSLGKTRGPDAQAPVLGRYGLKAVATPASGLVRPGPFLGPIAIVDGGSNLGASLTEALRTRGVDAILRESPASGDRGLIHLGGLSPNPTVEFGIALNKGVFQQARTLAPTLEAEGGLFVTVQNTGGRFGLGGLSFERAFIGGLTGLIRTAHQEWPKAQVKAIDLEVGGRDTKATATLIAKELLYGGPELEVGFTKEGERLTLKATNTPTTPGELAIKAGDVVVVSGGARGVTAASILKLAEVCPASFVLLGRTPIAEEPHWAAGVNDERGLTIAAMKAAKSRGEKVTPAQAAWQGRRVLAGREISRNISALRRLGAKARYVAVDVTDGAALTAAMNDVRGSWGPIKGVIHGAGVLADKRIAEKEDAMFDRVFDTKIQGLLALLAATKDDPISLMVFFSSVAARCGNNGQVDYAMANEILNKVAQAESLRRGPGVQVRSLGWGPWAGGMVTPELKAHFEGLGVALIPLDVGGQMLIDDIRDSGAEIEPVLGGEPRLKPLLSGQSQDPITLKVLITAESHPYLRHHAIQGVPVVPVVLVLEWFHRAARTFTEGGPVGTIRDLKVLRGIRLESFDGAGDKLYITVSQTPGGSLDLRLTDATGRPHYSAKADLVSPRAGQAPKAPSLKAWGARPIYGKTLFHGPDFQVIQGMEGVGDQGIAGTLSGVVDMGWPDEGWRTDPAALDGGLQMALLWTESVLNGPSLPTGIKEARVFTDSPPTGPLRCLLVAQDVGRDSARSDVLILDNQENPIAELKGVETHRLPGGRA